MAYVAGTYTASARAARLLIETEIMGDASRMSELKMPIVAGQAILMNQDPHIEEINLGKGKKCINAKVVNIRSASTLRANKTLACTILAGPEAGSDSLTLTKEVLTKPAAFTILDNQCDNEFDFNKKLAYQGLKAKIDLEVELTKVLIALAAANADVPTAAWFETPGTVVADAYEVTTANFGSNLIADALAASMIAKMPNSIILNGRNLFNDAILAQYKGAACCDNDSILNSQNYFQLYWDLLNMDAVLGVGYSLVMDKNSLVFWSSPNYTNMAPELQTGDVYAWVETLPRLTYYMNGAQQPIYVDVRAQKVCQLDAYGNESIGYNYEYVLRGAMVANLTNADARHGILKIRKVA